MKMKGIFLLAAAALFAAGQAFAGPIEVKPSPDSPPDGWPNADLQTIVNHITGASDPSAPHYLSVNDNQVHSSGLWSIGGTSTSTSFLKFQFAGYSEDTKFGIYDPMNAGNRLVLFDGGQHTAGQSTDLKFNGLGVYNRYVANYFNSDGIIEGYAISDDFGVDNLFGFFLESPEGIFYSDPSLNVGKNGYSDDEGLDHLVVIGPGTSTGTSCGKNPCLLGNEYIFGWEDKNSSGWDQDYNDFVVVVESVDPRSVPEPTALAMFGLGLLGLGFGLRMSRRRRS